MGVKDFKIIKLKFWENNNGQEKEAERERRADGAGFHGFHNFLIINLNLFSVIHQPEICMRIDPEKIKQLNLLFQQESKLLTSGNINLPAPGQVSEVFCQPTYKRKLQNNSLKKLYNLEIRIKDILNSL